MPGCSEHTWQPRAVSFPFFSDAAEMFVASGQLLLLPVRSCPWQPVGFLTPASSRCRLPYVHAEELPRKQALDKRNEGENTEKSEKKKPLGIWEKGAENSL